MEAVELIKEFSVKFNVDISGFNFEKYFYSEPGIFTAYNSVLPFKIKYLERAILLGKLDDSTINQ